MSSVSIVQSDPILQALTLANAKALVWARTQEEYREFTAVIDLAIGVRAQELVDRVLTRAVADALDLDRRYESERDRMVDGVRYSDEDPMQHPAMVDQQSCCKGADRQCGYTQGPKHLDGEC